ncbi:winged helix-turn-helix transcriptional regulator [Candidatus Bathyarchaeota archaeon]|nr:winged helix-turn-helix transcriptional regulator [Candidatus Bathyarchaeota archaeon]
MNGEEGEELRRLREEIEELKRELREVASRLRDGGVRPPEEAGRSHLRVDLGEAIGEYVSSILENVMAGIKGELDRSIFIGPKGIFVAKKDRVERPSRADPKRAAEVMSALGNEHRIRILEELTSGGRYLGELLELFPGMSAGTISSHLDVLKAAGLVVQEKERGRYLITIPGRIAYRMASQLANQINEGGE